MPIAERTTPLQPPSRSDLAWQDFVDGLRMWRVWLTFGWIDIRQRYRRSLLGPLWITASMAVMVVTLGFLYAKLFKIDVQEFIPFVAVGMLVWGFISSVFNDAGQLFTTYESYLKQIKLPYTIYVWRFVWSRVIIFAHNFVIYLAVILYFAIWPGAVALLAIPALLILVVNAFLISLSIAMTSTRFRDVPQMVSAVTQIVFFLTPVIWSPKLLGDRHPLVEVNPFFHLIEIVRMPLLGQMPTWTNVMVVLGVTLLNAAIAYPAFVKFRSRIPYWI